jgi:two-component system chemotaxis response regulator CheB
VIISLLTALDRNFRMPVLIVLHRNSQFDSSLDELLSTRTHTPIKEVEEKEIPQAGMVYLCPADYHVLLEQNHSFSLDYSERVNFSRPSIDVTFRSAADVYGDRLIALLLSGGNADGAEGMEYVKAQGGTTIVQDPLTAEVPYMPRQALSRITADVVASPADLPAAILQIT